MGGTSSEREVSLVSGRNVADALASLGKYDVVPVVLDEDSLSAMPADVDAAYIALHGGWGAESSRIAMDKVKTKLVLEMNAVPTAKWTLASPGAEKSPLPLPVVVKPPCDGSSVGISKVTSEEEWAPALEAALAAMKAPGEVLVEEYIAGREMTVGVIDGEALPVIEIVAPGGWYGYDAKYKSDETRYPFLEDEGLSARLRQIGLDAYRALGCRGVTRVDFRVDAESRPYVLELNTSPGFTSHSLVPKAGMKTGLTFAGVCDRILSAARCGK